MFRQKVNVANSVHTFYRSPKPELLQLLLDHLPDPAQKPSTPNGKLQASTTSHSINADSHSAHGSSQNGSGILANGHSHTADTNGHSSSGNSSRRHQNGNSIGQPLIEVDGQSNGISKAGARHQARELHDILQDEVEAYLDKRHIIDILHDFSGSRPPLASLLSCLRPLQPRLYSISSSQLEHPTHVQITVAVVKYVALGRDRIGVTSTFLKERMQVGSSCHVHWSSQVRLCMWVIAHPIYRVSVVVLVS